MSNMYIKWYGGELQLPVLPSEWTISSSQQNTTLNVSGFGEVNLRGDRALKSVSVSSFFPANDYGFIHGSFQDPYDYFNSSIKDIHENNKLVKLVITGSDVALWCTVESYEHGEKDGTGDVYYKIDFKEYRGFDEASLKMMRTTSDQINRQHLWKAGDRWPTVVKQVTGSSSGWQAVRKYNKYTINQAILKYRRKHGNTRAIEAKALVGVTVEIRQR